MHQEDGAFIGGAVQLDMKTGNALESRDRDSPAEVMQSSRQRGKLKPPIRMTRRRLAEGTKCTTLWNDGKEQNPDGLHLSQRNVSLNHASRPVVAHVGVLDDS